ncbi:LppU/SCO3897 family protein [Streptomyces sp. NPDC001393]
MATLPPLDVSPPDRRKVIRNRIILGLLVASIAASIAVNGFSSGSDDADSVQAGDCFENTGTAKDPHIKMHDCGDAHADYKVLKRIKDAVTSISCWDVKGATGSLTQVGSTSYVVCFKENTH